MFQFLLSFALVLQADAQQCLTNSTDLIISSSVFQNQKDEKAYIRSFLKERFDKLNADKKSAIQANRIAWLGEIYSLYNALTPEQKDRYESEFQKTIGDISELSEDIHFYSICVPESKNGERFYRELPGNWIEEILKRGLKSNSPIIRGETLQYADALRANGFDIDIDFVKESEKLVKLCEYLNSDSWSYLAVQSIGSENKAIEPYLTEVRAFLSRNINLRTFRSTNINPAYFRPLLREGEKGRNLILQGIQSKSIDVSTVFLDLSGELPNPPINELLAVLSTNGASHPANDFRNGELLSWGAASGLAKIPQISPELIEDIKKKNSGTQRAFIQSALSYSGRSAEDRMRIIAAFYGSKDPMLRPVFHLLVTEEEWKELVNKGGDLKKFADANMPLHMRSSRPSVPAK